MSHTLLSLVIFCSKIVSLDTVICSKEQPELTTGKTPLIQQLLSELLDCCIFIHTKNLIHKITYACVIRITSWVT